MYGLVEKYFSNDFCILANRMKKMLGIVMKKAKNQNATGER